MDWNLVFKILNAVRDFISSVGFPVALIVGLGALVWRLSPALVNRWERGTAALEKIAENLGGITVKQDSLHDAILNVHADVKEGFQRLENRLDRP